MKKDFGKKKEPTSAKRGKKRSTWLDFFLTFTFELIISLLTEWW